MDSFKRNATNNIQSSNLGLSSSCRYIPQPLLLLMECYLLWRNRGCLIYPYYRRCQHKGKAISIFIIFPICMSCIESRYRSLLSGEFDSRLVDRRWIELKYCNYQLHDIFYFYCNFGLHNKILMEKMVNFSNMSSYIISSAHP